MIKFICANGTCKAELTEGKYVALRGQGDSAYIECTSCGTRQYLHYAMIMVH